MANITHTDLAWMYLERCNRHAQDELLTMYEYDVTYRSNHYGAVAGLPELMRLSGMFFDKYPDAHWKVERVRSAEGDAAEFDFVMVGVDRETGKRVARKGRERLTFSDFGLIRHIEVHIENVQ